MKLYGSLTSPYVRRIRILLSQTPHEFLNLNIFEGEGRETLAAKNPIMKVPCLDDEGQVIYDSRVIFSYLTAKFDYSALTWDQENQLSLIDAVNDSFVELFLLKRSEIEASDDKLFVRLQKERIATSLQVLNQQVADGQFDGWDYPSVCLYTLIDWVEFRQLHTLKGLDHLKAFREQHVDRIEITATDPRR
ncbi:glutathione S-transferase family protein [Alteromonas pelagimontana]|uniref:Glutathione S-transferase family protein n=1 Tax=Alteromonas pelagimontana TaxID=1858656 RepID=A0A6M4MAV7_9ALTE|nr:glutathione S-transferase family protein [Alteromonas pelagimontana]QJR80119.1 glutathione S-transferase family protein [Alteromonas pelagimontana]